MAFTPAFPDVPSNLVFSFVKSKIKEKHLFTTTRNIKTLTNIGYVFICITRNFIDLFKNKSH